MRSATGPTGPGGARRRHGRAWLERPPRYNARVASPARAAFLGLAITGVVAGCRGILGIDALPAQVPADAGSDDAPSADVATDAVPGVDARPPYCATLSPTPQFCADFDEPDFEVGWANDTDAGIPDPGEIGGGTLSADRKLSLSAPASLLVSTPAQMTTGNISAIVVKTVPATSKLILQFELYVDKLDVMEAAGVTVAGLDFGNDGDIAIFLDKNGLELAVEGPGPDAGVAAVQHITAFPSGSWTLIELIVSKVATIGTGEPGGWVNVECLGGSTTAALPLLIQNRTVPFQVVLGSSPGAPVGPFTANMDNVQMYWE